MMNRWNFVPYIYPPRRKGNLNSHGARLVHLIMMMKRWIRTSGLSTRNSLSVVQAASEALERIKGLQTLSEELRSRVQNPTLPPPILRGAIAKVNSPVRCPDQGLLGHFWCQFPCNFRELAFEIAPRRIGGGTLTFFLNPRP